MIRAAFALNRSKVSGGTTSSTGRTPMRRYRVAARSLCNESSGCSYRTVMTSLAARCLSTSILHSAPRANRSVSASSITLG